MIKATKVGIYGGTFDPIHFGHINLALEIMEIHQLDEVWFCPTSINPHKIDAKPTPAEHRLKMLEIALSDIPQFGILDFEVNYEGPSYTIDTLRKLIEKEKEEVDPKEFSLIIGNDLLSGFHQWKQPEEIVKLVPILVGQRISATTSFEIQGSPEVREVLAKGITAIPIMEISAAEIRKRLREGRYIGHLVPSKVIDYISSNELYSKSIN